MSKTYRKYTQNEDHCWYDSSNIIYSVFFNGSMKVVFKGGRTYLYKNVDPIDYTMFRDGESQGKIFNERIKKYDCIKMQDTDLDKLQNMKDSFTAFDAFVADLGLRIDMNDATGEFKLYKNNTFVFQGIENNFSITDLLAALNIKYDYQETEEHNHTLEDFENKNITD